VIPLAFDTRAGPPAPWWRRLVEVVLFAIGAVGLASIFVWPI
jgi:hypothetical protein